MKLVNQFDLDFHIEHARAQLWEAQLKFWPGSVQLSVREMFDWASEPTEYGEREQLRRFRVMALALQCPVHVFYRTASGYIGCRYGIDGPEYISGFTL